MADQVGQQLDTYRLIRLLGAGGFGEVYLAEHIYRNTQVAIKILPQLAKDDLNNFLIEARTFRLKHPNIVPVLDFGVEGRTPFIVMEYAPNGTLRELHPKGTRVPLPTLVSYVKQTASALQYAHDERLVHRDVKPENMLIGAQNQVLLSDFGIATIAHSTSSQSVETMAGTIPYMAPEQIQGHSRPASDQYSLGVVVYEWLCGDRPFHGTLTEVAVQHAMMPPPSLHEKGTTIPPDVEHVVKTALAKDPKQRFGSVQAFANALEQASQPKEPVALASVTTTEVSTPQHPLIIATSAMPLSQQLTVSDDAADTSAQPDDTAPEPGEVASVPVMVPLPDPSLQPDTLPLEQRKSRPTQGSISRRTLVLGLGVAGLAVTGGGLAWLVSSQVQHPSVPSTPTPPKSLLYTYRGHSKSVHAVAWSPNGKRIASGSADGTVQVWDAADGSHVYTYQGHSDFVYAVAWSPDGTRIASASFDKTVQVWDAAGGGHAYTYHGHANAVEAVAWSPDSTRIASGSDDQTVQVWDAADGSHVYTYRGHSGHFVLAVAWSPNGKRIASGGFDDSVQVWDAADGGHVYTYQGHSFVVKAVAWSPTGLRIASGSDDQTVQVWDADGGGHVYTYHGSYTVVAVTWSPNGKRIASGGGDTTVQVWDAATGGHIYTYQGHSDFVDAVAWSPDGTHIASGSDDQTVQVWQAP